MPYPNARPALSPSIPLPSSAASTGVPWALRRLRWGTPSLVIILLIASILDQFAHYPAVIHAFAGVRVSVAVLIVNTVYHLFKSNVKGNIAVIIAVAAFLLVAILSLSPVLIVIAAAVVGIVAGRRQA